MAKPIEVGDRVVCQFHDQVFYGKEFTGIVHAERNGRFLIKKTAGGVLWMSRKEIKEVLPCE